MADQDSRRLAPAVLLGGGIGAGKTRISTLFAVAGFLVISSDEVGRQVLAPGSDAVAEVEALWPHVVDDGVVDRSGLAAHVFEDPAELSQLEHITHPAIEADIRRQIEATQLPVVVEVPILSVLSDEPFLRVAVIADDNVRLERAVARGGIAADVLRRMERQPTGDEWRTWATYVIDNSGDWEATVGQTRRVIEEVMAHG